jgi:hypothetical protein
MYQLITGQTKLTKRTYKTRWGLRRRLDLQAETTARGAKDFGSLLVEGEHIALTFHKSEDGNEWGWRAEPGIPWGVISLQSRKRSRTCL